MKIKSYAAFEPHSNLKPHEFERREKRNNDVIIEILYSGVCHSDIHQANNDWGMSIYPLVPGHEIVGKVTETGETVTNFKVGDIVGVGCMVDSCLECNSCNNNEEQYCQEGFTGTYSDRDKIDDSITYGGYATSIIVREEFVVKIPTTLDLKAVAPILCAGVTTWSPLKHWNVKKGDNVAIIGLGGLGHMAVKLAKALGANVTVFSRSADKIQNAKDLGANEVIISTNNEQMKSVANSFDLILDTVSANHDINIYMSTLSTNGTLVMLGHIGDLNPTLSTVPLVMNRKAVAGSVIGGIKETQELLDFCGEHNITADVEMINIQDINDAYRRMEKSDVKYRFVIDMSSLNN